MPRFQNSTQKYDQNGNKVPKGVNGIKQYHAENPDLQIFDSKSEYEIFEILKNKEKMGEISDLQCKVKFVLVEPSKWYNNIKQKMKNIRELAYITDFVFIRDGKKIAVDCKGWKFKIDKKSGKEKWQVYYDEIYKIKKKIFISKYSDEYIFEEM